MAENTAIAESYTAPEPQITVLPKSGTTEYAQWRVSGDLPEIEPKAESAPAAVEPGEATTPPVQERTEKKRRPDAEARIKTLTDEAARLRAELDEARKPKEQSKPKLVEPQYTRPKPTVDDKVEGKPKYATYEDFTEELADWKAEQRMADYEKRQTAKAQMAETQKKIDAATARYENFDEISRPFVKEMLDSTTIPIAVKQMVADSEVWPDLIFTIASNAEDRAEFLQLARTQPGKALRYIAKVESLIEEALSGNVPRGTPERARSEDGTFVKPEPVAPAKRGPESASEPPLEVSNRGAGVMDESGRALSALKAGNPNAVRDWLKAENAKDLRRRRGA